MSEFSTRAGGLAEVRPKVPRADLSDPHPFSESWFGCESGHHCWQDEARCKTRGKPNAGDDLTARGRHPWSPYSEGLSGCAVAAVVVGMEGASAHARAHPDLTVVELDPTRFQPSADHQMTVVLPDATRLQTRAKYQLVVVLLDATGPDARANDERV